MKRALVILGVVVLLVGGASILWKLTGFNGLIYLTTAYPNTLIPILEPNDEAKRICELVFDGLVNKTTLKDGKEQYEWALAKENGIQEVSSEDRTHIIVSLRKGVSWHDGRELVAADVVYTFKAINASNSPLKGWLSAFIESVDPIEGDNYTLRVALTREMSKEGMMELFSPVKILPRWYVFDGRERELPENLRDETEIAKQFKWHPVGTGPYKIKQRKSETIEFEANEEYYLTRPEIKKVRTQVDIDILRDCKALKNTSLGLMLDFKPECRDILSDSLQFESQLYLPYSFYAIIYNTRRQPFQNQSFRKGINSGIDKARLAEAFLDKPEYSAECINRSIYPAKSMYVQDCPSCFVELSGYDPGKAKEYLRESRIEKGSFRLMISTSRDGEKAKSLAASFVQMLQEIGIQVEVDDFVAPQYDKKLKEYDFDVVFIQLSGFDHLYDVRPLFADLNYWRVQDDRLNRLLVEFGRTLNWYSFADSSGNVVPGLRDLAKEIHARIEEIAPACFLFTVPKTACYSDKLTNVTIHPEVAFSTIEKWHVRQ